MVCHRAGVCLRSAAWFSLLPLKQHPISILYRQSTGTVELPYWVLGELTWGLWCGNACSFWTGDPAAGGTDWKCTTGWRELAAEWEGWMGRTGNNQCPCLSDEALTSVKLCWGELAGSLGFQVASWVVVVCLPLSCATALLDHNCKQSSYWPVFIRVSQGLSEMLSPYLSSCLGLPVITSSLVHNQRWKVVGREQDALVTAETVTAGGANI